MARTGWASTATSTSTSVEGGGCGGYLIDDVGPEEGGDLIHGTVIIATMTGLDADREDPRRGRERISLGDDGCG